MKTKHLLLSLVVLCCLELSFLTAPFMVWFWLQVTLVAAIFFAGVTTRMCTKARGVSPLLLSSAVVAGLAGVAVYWIFPLVHTPAAFSAPTSNAEAVARALAEALGPLYFATLAMGGGLLVGWVPAWVYVRLRPTDVPFAAS